MSKQKKAFRPSVSEVLEIRTVPSGFGGFGFNGDFPGIFGAGNESRGWIGANGGSSANGATSAAGSANTTSGSNASGGWGVVEFNSNGQGFGIGEGFRGRGGYGGGGDVGGAGYGSGGVQTTVSKDTQTVAQAFNTFQQSYKTDVQTILYGSGTPSSNRAAFDTQVGKDLTTLENAVDAALGNITGTANQTLISSINADLTGTASTSLQSTLAAITTPTSTSGHASRSFTRQSNSDIYQALDSVGQLLQNATVPTGTVTSTTVQTLSSSINTAYQNFTQGYLNAEQTAATDPSKNRAAFDTAVQGLITTLSSSINTAVTAANLPSSVSTSITTSITNDLTGTPSKGTNLQSSLSALTSPSSTTGFAGWYFNARSRGVVNSNERLLGYDILSAINTYNTSLTE